MRLVKPSAEIHHLMDPAEVPAFLERAARTCYKSEDNVGPDTAIPFLKKYLIKPDGSGHESVLEHASVAAHIVCDRGGTHELVRHRIGAYSQESTRFCNYAKGKFGGHITFVIPPWVTIHADDYKIGLVGASIEYADTGNVVKSLSELDYEWAWAMLQAEKQYFTLSKNGWSPQQARSVLPNSLKTEIIATYNLRQWRHVFKLRWLGVTGTPHPQMVEIMDIIMDQFKESYPWLVEDIVAAKEAKK